MHCGHIRVDITLVLLYSPDGELIIIGADTARECSDWNHFTLPVGDLMELSRLAISVWSLRHRGEIFNGIKWAVANVAEHTLFDVR